MNKIPPQGLGMPFVFEGELLVGSALCATTIRAARCVLSTFSSELKEGSCMPLAVDDKPLHSLVYGEGQHLEWH